MTAPDTASEVLEMTTPGTAGEVSQPEVSQPSDSSVARIGSKSQSNPKQARAGATRASLLDRIQDMIPVYDEGPPEGGFRAIVEHRIFNGFITFAIISYSVYVGVETDYKDSGGSDMWLAIEITYGSIFAIELILRVGAYGLSFFFGPNAGWNIFDFILVTSAVLDTFVITLLLSDSSDALGLIAALRILRMLRLARIFRLIRFVKELWLLLAGVLDALRTLFWAMLLIVLFIYVCGILMTRTVGQPHAGKPCDEDFLGIDALFGTVPVSMFTLFAVLTTDQWADIARCTMMYEPWTWIFYLVFLACTAYAMMNVIVAVVVEGTMEQASQQKGDIHKKQEAERQEAIHKIGEVFKKADEDGNGLLTRQEFMTAVHQAEVQEYLMSSGIDLRLAGTLFDILDYDDSGCLDADEFVRGAMRARGDAQAKEILSIQCDIWRFEMRYRQELDRFQEDIKDSMAMVDVDIESVRADVRDLIAVVRDRLPQQGQLKAAASKGHGMLVPPADADSFQSRTSDRRDRRSQRDKPNPAKHPQWPHGRPAESFFSTDMTSPSSEEKGKGVSS